MCTGLQTEVMQYLNIFITQGVCNSRGIKRWTAKLWLWMQDRDTSTVLMWNKIQENLNGKGRFQSMDNYCAKGFEKNRWPVFSEQFSSYIFPCIYNTGNSVYIHWHSISLCWEETLKHYKTLWEDSSCSKRKLLVWGKEWGQPKNSSLFLMWFNKTLE